MLENNKGLFLYKSQQGKYDVRGTDVLDLKTVQSVNTDVEVITIYSLPNDNVVNSIAAQVVYYIKRIKFRATI